MRSKRAVAFRGQHVSIWLWMKKGLEDPEAHMNVTSCPQDPPQESSGRQSCMTQAGRSPQLPFPHSLGGCTSDQEEQTGHWSVFSTLNMCCLKETLIILFDLILTAPLQGWDWVIFILQEINQRQKRFYCLSMLLDEALAFHFPVPLSLYGTMPQGRKGTQKSATNTYWAPTVCQILRSKTKSLLSGTYFRKSVWTRGESPCIVVLTLLFIWCDDQLVIQYLGASVGGNRTYPAFSLSLWSGSNESAENKKAVTFISTSMWAGTSFPCDRIHNVRMPGKLHWPRISKLVNAPLRDPANFTTGS